MLDLAESGRTTIIIRNGQAVAQITPPPQLDANGAAVAEFLASWGGDPNGFSPEYLNWLDILGESNARDKGRLSWVDGLR